MKTMMRMVILVLVTTLTTALLALTGCESGELTVQSIQANSIAAVQKVDSYKMDYDMAMEIETVGGDKTVQMTASGIGTAISDVREQEMQMNMDMDMQIRGAGTAQMSMTISMEIYSIGDWIYMKMDIPGAGEQWMKMENSSEISQDEIAQWLSLLTSATTVTLSGSEKINSIDCYVLEIVPDINALWAWMMSQQGSQFAGDVDFSEFDISDIIKNYGYKNWIAKNNYQLVKVEAELDVEMDAETFGGTTEDFENMTMIMNMTMTFFDYNKTVNIELPEEALDAEEVDSF